MPSDVDALIDELLDTLQRALSDAARAELIDALRDVARERRDQVHRV